ncbi:MAG TPA: Hpt domain-containing protein [Puia sp.]|nr:Hpt domain-containing protein [Puia sp.]
MKPYSLSMLEELDDKPQMRQLVELFLTNTPLQIRDLLAEAGNKEWKKVYANAHKLKGGAGIFQASELVVLSQQIEKLANVPGGSAVDEDSVNGLLLSLTAAFSKIEILLSEELKNL